MLFPPQRKKRIRKPAPVRLEFVDDSMTGGANRHQPFPVVNAGPPVMDGRLVPCPAACLAGLALVSIAGEHFFADAGKVPGRVPTLPVAGTAEPGDCRVAAAIGAEERFLAKIGHGSIIAADNEDYH